MYAATIFIISKRKELSIKYKKLIEALNQEVYVIPSLSEALLKIQETEPELLIVSDTIEEGLPDFCAKMRALTCNIRPVIIAISKSSDIDDKLKILESGADDFMDESIAPKEFQARIKAHLRRYLENSFNPITFFALKNLSAKMLKKLISGKKNASVMLGKIANINTYREIYGEIAYQKVLQTLGAIVNSTLGAQDFAGHFFDDEFIIITNEQKVEKIASFLTFAFDNVLSRFYNKRDYENNFTLLSSDIKEEEREGLMRLEICATEYKKEKFNSYEQIINELFGLIKLCKNTEKSCYIIDRPKLYGEVKEKRIKNRVLIMEEDEPLSLLLETLCSLNSLDARVCTEYENFFREYENFMPDVVIIDYGDKSTKEGLEISRKIKQNKNYAPKIIFSSSLHNKEEILTAGADFYIPKPYEADDMIKRIKKFLTT